MGATRRRHSAEFKVEAVRVVSEKGLSVARVAQDLGIDRSLLTKWRRELTTDPDHSFPGKGRLKPTEEENRRLRKELEIVRQERDILKKATVHSTGQCNIPRQQHGRTHCARSETRLFRGRPRRALASLETRRQNHRHCDHA